MEKDLSLEEEASTQLWMVIIQQDDYELTTTVTPSLNVSQLIKKVKIKLSIPEADSYGFYLEGVGWLEDSAKLYSYSSHVPSKQVKIRSRSANLFLCVLKKVKLHFRKREEGFQAIQETTAGRKSSVNKKDSVANLKEKDKEKEKGKKSQMISNLKTIVNEITTELSTEREKSIRLEKELEETKQQLAAALERIRQLEETKK